MTYATSEVLSTLCEAGVIVARGCPIDGGVRFLLVTTS
jgi:hypothetical protein